MVPAGFIIYMHVMVYLQEFCNIICTRSNQKIKKTTEMQYGSMQTGFTIRVPEQRNTKKSKVIRNNDLQNNQVEIM